MTIVVVDAKLQPGPGAAAALFAGCDPAHAGMAGRAAAYPGTRTVGVRVVTGLRRACHQRLLSLEQAQTSLDELLGMELEVVPASPKLHRRALEWAERLGQSRAYDSQYLALAEQVNAELWTGDRRLANGAAALGVDWVHWVGEA